MYGATTIAIEGNFDDALRIVRELGDVSKVEVVNSINPVRIEGQKTASFEVVNQLGQKRQTFTFYPSVTPATSPFHGEDIRNIMMRGK